MKLLIVNDNDTNLKILTMILSKDNYDIRTANTNEDIISKLSAGFDLIIIPDNYELCKAIKSVEDYKNTPIIIISPNSNTDDIIRGFACGADDYITFPFKPDEVRKRISDRIKFQSSAKTQMENILAIAKLAQSKDDDSGNHLERIKRYCKVLAEELRKPIYKQQIDDNFINNIELASPLHDIGKVGLPDSILLKSEKLSENEFEEMKKHTINGFETLKKVKNKFGSNDFIQMAMDIARFHHERYDGYGYPDQLKGTNIPLAARILAVADVYDALRTQKEYNDSLSHEKSFEVIKGGRETQFDYIVIKALKKVHREFEKIWEELKD